MQDNETQVTSNRNNKAWVILVWGKDTLAGPESYGLYCHSKAKRMAVNAHNKTGDVEHFETAKTALKYQAIFYAVTINNHLVKYKIKCLRNNSNLFAH